MVLVRVVIFVWLVLFAAVFNIESKYVTSRITCIPVTECPLFLNVLTKRPLTPECIAMVRQASCGFIGHVEKVWCPIFKLQNPNVNNNNFNKNITMRNEQENEISTSSETSEYAGVTRMALETRDAGKDPDVSTIAPTLMEITRRRKNLLPSDKECGKYTEDRIFGGDATALDEYPWTAMMLYRNARGKLEPQCGGTLISNRHVLTAAHCITQRGPPEVVVLGEYDFNNATDCIYYSDGMECSPTPLRLKIQNATIHPQWLYNQNNNERIFYNDIAVIRLDQEVSFNDFVAPICLMDATNAGLKAGTPVLATGWGITENRTKSNVKLKVTLPLVTRKNCSLALGKTIGPGQICAGGVVNKDACNGDSGGPLMYFDSNAQNWRLAGIISAGVRCGAANKPGIYTWVPQYSDWIYENLF